MIWNEALRLQEYLRGRKAMVEEALAGLVPGEDMDPQPLFKAVRYSLLAGGKRLRPILCMAAAETVGGEPRKVLPAGCAIEFIHTYSLIHDDLPAMDNDDYRRGRLTSHKVFGEATAILAGDALLTEAFRLLTGQSYFPGMAPARLLRVTHELASAAGWFGMVGGQVIDIQAEGQTLDREALDRLQRLKTGAMILVSLRSGAILSGANEEALAALSDYGRRIGLAFQIADDLLNVEGDPTLMGKGTGSDVARGKVTFPSLLGMQASRNEAGRLIDEAIGALVGFDERADPLRWIAHYILERDH